MLLYPLTRRSPDHALAKEYLITVDMLANDQQFFRWVSYLPDDQQDDFVKLRDEYLAGFKSYLMPCVVLPKEVPLSALAKIFETINRTGVRLDAFDLMVARLYPYNFYLRDEWEQAKANFNPLRDFNVEGIEILKLIALLEHIRQSEGSSRITVKGVRESDVLQLNPAAVTNDWTTAVASYDRALRYLRDRCSVVSPGLLPSKAMVLPIASALRTDESQRQDFEGSVKKWFWAAAFQQTYSQGANTQAVADAKALRAWNSDSNAAPRDVREFRFDLETLQDQRRRNEMLVRGIACLLAQRGARDWIQGDKQISDGFESLDFHHVFASRHLESIGVGDSDLVANLTPIFSSSNQALRDQPPSVVAERTDISRSALESHSIDWALFKEGEWETYLDARSERLEALIREAVQ